MVGINARTFLAAIALLFAALLIEASRTAADTIPAVCTEVFRNLPTNTMQRYPVGVLTQETCEAYKFLLERNGTGTRGTGNGCYQSQADRIIRLAPGFAVGLHKALSRMETEMGTGKNIIQSGYRCDDINSNHNRGCAADIIYASCSQRYPRDTEAAWRCSSDSFDSPEQRWIDANGRNAPYNIHLRLRYAPEGHHVEPVSTQGCTTGRMVTRAPLGLGDTTRTLLGGLTPPPPLLPMQPLPVQMLPTQASPLNSFMQPAPTPTMSTTTASSTVADRLENLAFGTTSGAHATTAPFAVTISGNDVGGINSALQQNASSSSGGGSVTQQTFTSQDLAWQTSAPQNTFQKILASLTEALVRLLAYLKPFGRPMTHEQNEYSY